MINEINIKKFAEVYTKKLDEAVLRNPGAYVYGTDKVPEVAAKMTHALAAGTANLSNVGKAVARELGVKPTQRDIKAYLCAEESR